MKYIKSNKKQLQIKDKNDINKIENKGRGKSMRKEILLNKNKEKGITLVALVVTKLVPTA